MKIGFDSEKYMQIQSKHILERIDNFGGKLYLEFGGKLFDDLHASRVLPGFDENAKIKLLQKLKDKCEIIFASARRISKEIKSARTTASLTARKFCGLSTR